MASKKLIKPTEKPPSRFADWGPTTGLVWLCATCKWKQAGVPTCAAFPAGIPEKIADGRFEHTKRFPGDHGIRYEQRELKP